MSKMSFRSKNSHKKTCRNSCAQHSNSPTNTVLKYYYLIYQFIIGVCLCWNQKFLLELVGITVNDFSYLVGTKKGSNSLPEGTSKNFIIHYQSFNELLMPLLDCWAVGTENDLLP